MVPQILHAQEIVAAKQVKSSQSSDRDIMVHRNHHSCPLSEPPMTQVSIQEHFIFPEQHSQKQPYGKRGSKQASAQATGEADPPSQQSQGEPRTGSRREHQAVWSHIQAALMVPSQLQHPEGCNRRCQQGFPWLPPSEEAAPGS